MTQQNPNKRDIAATNRKAHHNFFIEETYEAGIVLVGTEVKSLRKQRVDLNDSFARFERDALFLYNAHISPNTHSLINHEPLRKRTLLLQKHELLKLWGKVQQKGLTLVPLSIYFNERGWAKVELALARGRKNYDKRARLAERTAKREIERGHKATRQPGLRQSPP